MGSVTICFFLLSLIVVCSACPRFTHPLSCGKCVAIITTAQSRSAAKAACASDYSGGELITVVTADELRVVRQYAARLGGNDAFWVGYQYIGNDLTSAIDNNMAPSLITDEVTAGSGSNNCLVILKNGSFEGRSCGVSSQSICLFNFTSPSPTITVAPAGNIIAGSTVTITCEFQSSIIPDTILFLRGGDPVSFGSVMNSSASATLTITSFLASMNGGYECRTSVSGETAVSRVVNVSIESITPAASGITTQLNGTAPPTNPVEFEFGTPITLSCSFSGSSSSSRIEWFINGFITITNVSTASDGSASTLSLSAVSTPGVYQCRIRNTDGTSGVRSFVLCGNLAENTPPGSVNIFGVPKTRNSLTITFLPPGNTIDSLLTTTSIFYRNSRYTDYTDASSKDLVVDSSATGRYEYTLSGLSAGTRYWVAARATNMMGQEGDEAPFLTVLDTFGNPPTIAPTGLSLVVTPDNMTLFADWETVQTVRPVGPLAFYEVQFTSRQAGVVNTLRILPDFSFSVVTGVTRGDFYQVRVRSAVQVGVDPDMFDYSPYTDYEGVSGIVEPSNVPTPPPTLRIGLADEEVIAISVVVPFVILGVILAIVCVVIGLLYFNKSRVPVEPTNGKEMSEVKRP